jgi:hypothetical protein
MQNGDFLTYPAGPGITLHVYPAPPFKTLSLHVFFQRPLDGGTTAAAILPSMLRRGCRRLPTQRAIAAFLDGLYGASCSSGVFKFGERQILHVRLDVVNDRFAPGRARILAPSNLRPVDPPQFLYPLFP